MKQAKRISKRKEEPQGEVCGTANNESLSSIEIARDAKGVVRWTIKLYGNRGEMDNVVEDLASLDRSLQERFK